MVLGMLRVHEGGFCHGDVKLENFLYRDDMHGVLVVVSDFGFAASLPGDWDKRSCCYCCPPEATSTFAYWLPYDGAKADVWSLGVCLAMMLSGEGGSYKTPDLNAAMESPALQRCSKSVRELLRGMLQQHPDARWSLRDVLCHPWLGDEPAMDDDEPAMDDVAVPAGGGDYAPMDRAPTPPAIAQYFYGQRYPTEYFSGTNGDKF